MAGKRRIRRRLRRSAPVIRRAPAAGTLTARTEAKKHLSGGGDLLIGSTQDPAERAAARLAEQVTGPTGTAAQDRDACPACAAGLVRRDTGASPPSAGGGASGGTSTVGAVPASPVAAVAIGALDGGRPLGPAERARFEPRFGRDFSDVRVHDGGAGNRAAAAVGAKAFALGRDIAFAQGRYKPGSAEGDRLLAHELAHVSAETGAGLVRRAETEDRPSVCAPLTDIASDVNTWVNREIAAARRAPGTAPVGPFLAEVATRTGGNGPIAPIETHIENMPATKRFLPTSSLAGTRYAGAPNVNQFYQLQTRGLAHVVGSSAKVSGQCIGADKLGHFFQQGYQYYDIRNRSSQATAESFGRYTEIAGAGLATTGVYSNADLAANLAGLTFYDQLRANPGGFTFDIANFISSNWNEYANPNFYEASLAGEVWATQLTGAWSGSFQLTGATLPISVTLNATAGGTVTGTFSYHRPPYRHPTTGQISGTITYNTTRVSGRSARASLFGLGGTSSATPVSGITIQFDWNSGSNSGKGEWSSAGEHQLRGTYGNGTSRTNAGAFNLDRP